MPLTQMNIDYDGESNCRIGTKRYQSRKSEAKADEHHRLVTDGFIISPKYQLL